MDCPNCGLLNPPETGRCDCGYDFVEGVVKDNHLDEKDMADLNGRRRRRRSGLADTSPNGGELMGPDPIE